MLVIHRLGRRLFGIRDFLVLYLAAEPGSRQLNVLIFEYSPLILTNLHRHRPAILAC
jgi:hypothetical protein